MKNKILIPLLILGGLAAFFSFRYSGGEDSQGDQRKVLIQQTVMKAIKEGHFAPRDINDTFSYRVYNKILQTLDYEKKFLTQKDINALNEYQYKIDDEINSNEVVFSDKINELYNKRVEDAAGYYKDILSQPFSFTANEQVQLDGDKMTWAADDAALKDRWRLYLKYRVLAKYIDLKKDREKALADKGKDKDKSKDTLKTKTDAELEASARESVRKNQDLYFKRLRKLKDEDLFALYMNTITGNEDPHTDYLPPKDKQTFDEMMSGTFFGIGAQLREENGKIKIVAIITGSPCWKQGELKAGDEILKISKNDTDVDVEGYDVEDVVKLIRGKKNTEVRLTVKKVDGATKVIPIIRGEISIDETFAKSAIFNTKTGPVGYIYLPEFYADFQHSNGRHCSEDVAIEIQKLKAANVTGIILDLRYNGGGSLNDVVEMAGLFIDQGPVVQVKGSGMAPMTLRDANKGILYAGPLAIMVNQSSASASEIMAAAMQDYKRAVIVGTPTYGKGTVQKVIGLDEFVDPLARLHMQSGNEQSIGSLKITMQKFYRVNGGSTQLRGVTPDVKLPDLYQYISSIGESKDKAALQWDEIPAAVYQAYPNPVNGAALNALSQKRVATNPIFGLIQQNAQELKKKKDDNAYSLNEATYRKELDEDNASAKKIEEIEKKTTPLDVVNLKDDMARINTDSLSITKNKDWLKMLKKDIYISETVNIINDMASQNMKVANAVSHEAD